MHLFSALATRSYLDADFAPGDALVFGKESVGLSDEITAKYNERLVGIPTLGAVRSLNLANAVGIALFEALRRAGALAEAELAVETALERGAGPAALRTRGEIAKARGDRARALADFEELSRELDSPTLRLELAKLYEHFVKEPLKALEVALAGTGESPAESARRVARLERKAGR